MARRRRPPRSGAIGELPPLRILAQIAALQSIYYVVALVLMSFTSLAMGIQFKLDFVFGWASLRGDTTQGWLIGFIWLCCAATVVVALVALISRSKLILDFAFTLHFIHLIVVFLYTGFLPRNVAWWATMLISGVVMVAGGTYGCRWRELQPITFGGNSSKGAATTASADDGAAGEEYGDVETGLPRGRGRGRGRDGTGEYEMVNMPSEAHK